MQQYEYLVVDNGFMFTNRAGVNSTTDESMLSKKLTDDFGSNGWALVGIVGDDFVFMRPSVEQQAEVKTVMQKKGSIKANDQ